VAQGLEAAAAIAATRGDPGTAAQLLGAAAAVRGRIAAPPAPEEETLRVATAGQARGALGDDAAESAERAGRGLAAASAVALARGVLSGRGAAPGPVPAPVDALTPREREVAQLVRRGRTNRQIGRQLGIAEKTAEVHVHNIIRKLGASSRAEVAAWVAAGTAPGAAPEDYVVPPIPASRRGP
jgi:DNA-binding NarL/FixJ family response regulator